MTHSLLNLWMGKNRGSGQLCLTFLLNSSAQNKELLVVDGPKEDIQVNATLVLIKPKETPQTQTC